MDTAVVAPRPVSAPWVWTADEIDARKDWIVRLPDAAIDEIDRALADVKARDLPLRQITARDFPLPSFAGELARVRQLLGDGPGLAVIRGVPVERYGRQDIELVLWGSALMSARPW